MIDWSKPIETVDGYKAHKLASIMGITDQSSVHCVRVDIGSGAGEVYLVDNEGFRCDYRASDEERSTRFIRHPQVTRNGWVAVFKNEKGTYISKHIFNTKEEAWESEGVWSEFEGAFPFRWEE
jgi:hypothetical protein